MVLIAYALWLVFVLTWNVFDRSVRTLTAAGAGRERLFTLVIAAGMIMMVLAPVMRSAGTLWVNPLFIDLAMLLLMASGITWCWWARRNLGRLWSAAVTHKEGHSVVDTGPYRLVRHPIYTGFIAIYVGMAIICTTPLAFAAVPVLVLGLWLKARVEERFLIEELRAATYGAYRARTPMLIPRLIRDS